jgi:hypothetical protein
LAKFSIVGKPLILRLCFIGQMLLLFFGFGAASFVGGWRKVDPSDEMVVFAQNAVLGAAGLFPEADGVSKIVGARTQIVAGFNVAADVLAGSLQVRVVVWVNVQQKKQITSIEQVSQSDWIWKDAENVDPHVFRLVEKSLKLDRDVMLKIEKVLVYRVKGTTAHLVFEGSDGKLHGIVVDGQQSGTVFYKSFQ